ncbi:MAG: precorrin-2 C(20)-methyltransferase [Oscillospiraceae bacterium]|nr:precorrin-2 C(20)-methyltransferase [Oscillospiraceae bacterium]
MRGIAYGVGVGPGDPELMTQKAIRRIRECGVIAVPGREAEASVAYRIAAAMVPELRDKELVAIEMPMTKDRALLEAQHRRGAQVLEQYLTQGRDVAFLTLGDPTVYSTFSYLQHILEVDGYRVELVPGVPSFCAAAARLGLPLAEWDEPLHIVPAVHKTEEPLSQSGTYVLMKSASHMAEVKALLRQSGRVVACVENGGMDTEKVYRGVEEIPDDAGYLSLIIAKERRR